MYLTLPVDKLKKILYDFRENFEDGEISVTFSTYECDISMDYLTRIGDFNGDGNTGLIPPANNDAGIIASREDVLTDQKELFSYDDLNRLTKVEYYLNDNHVSSSDIELEYSADGNINSKTDVGQLINYGEDNAGPHALTSVEAPAASYVPRPQCITYTDFNKVSGIVDTIAQDTTISMEINYGLFNQRTKSIWKQNTAVSRIKYYHEDFEIDSSGAGVKKYNYISSPTGIAAIFVQQGAGNDTMYYVAQDHLGSISAVINQQTNSVQHYSFSSWGKPRNPDNWAAKHTGELFAERGFTGHEHLMDFGLINMNGRVYDPMVSRFLSPDPFIQAANNLNSYNRFSYVSNNPLLYIDPTGYLETPLRSEETLNSGTASGGYTIINDPPFFGRGTGYEPNMNQVGIGRFIRNPGPTDVILDKHGNEYYSYQDPISGIDGAYYTDNEGRTVFSVGAQNYVWKSKPFFGTRWVQVKIDGQTNFVRDFGVVGYKYYFEFAKNGGGLNPYSLSGEARLALAGGSPILGPMAGLAHFPDAVSVELNGSAGAVVSTNTSPVGVLFKTNRSVKGPNAQSFFQGSVGASANAIITEYYILGKNASSVTMTDFSGYFGSFDLGVDIGISVGAGVSFQRVKNGAYIVGISYSVGVGVGASLNLTGGVMDYYSNY